MKTRTDKATFIQWRFYFLIVTMVLIVVALLLRIVDLAIFKRPFLLAQGNSRALRVLTDTGFRGLITDRMGYPLAVSVSVYSLWINPKEFVPDPKIIKLLAELLQQKPALLLANIQQSRKKHKAFAYLKRDVSPDIANKIKALHIPHLYLQQEYKRFYPEGPVTAHLLGFTNIDEDGQEGIELQYNEWLKGTPGKTMVMKDCKGQVISNLQTIQNKKPGQNLALSIHHRIQYLAYRELLQGVQKNVASSGSIVVLDIKTGEVLAMVNDPSFNPNDISANKKDTFRNRAVTDIFEPGSTVKAFSIATALDSGAFKPDTVIDTYPGWLRVGRHIVRDEHNHKPLTVTQILQSSSNVGVTKMMLVLPPSQLSNLLHRLGFGEVTGAGFPGEQPGKLVSRVKWDPFTVATLSFGYGISTTALQLAHAYATLANEGVKIPVSFMRVTAPLKGQQVMNPKIANQMVKLLESVVAKGGTGESARIPGYHVAGKTGTAIKVGEHGYEKHHYTSSFIGIAPATHPRLVVAVIIHDPQGKKYYGGDVSAPVFQKVMEGALNILNIPPDDL